MGVKWAQGGIGLEPDGSSEGRVPDWSASGYGDRPALPLFYAINPSVFAVV